MTGVAFLVRYEAIPFALAIGAALATRQVVRTRGRFGPLVPTALYFGVPILVAAYFWLKFNWDVTGDPLFFFSGPYSNVAQTAYVRTPGHDLFPYYRDPLAAGWFALTRVWLLSPSAAILCPVVLLALVLAATATPLTAVGMADRTVGRMEWGLVAHLAGRPYEPRAFTQYRSERAAARDLDARAERTPVLIDTVAGYPAIAFSRYPAQFVSTTDVDFEAILHRPYGTVEYILVHDPNDATDPNPMSPYGRVLQVHPELLDGNAEWATLERKYGAWTLFRVGSPPPTQAALDVPTDAP